MPKMRLLFFLSFLSVTSDAEFANNRPGLVLSQTTKRQSQKWSLFLKHNV